MLLIEFWSGFISFSLTRKMSRADSGLQSTHRFIDVIIGPKLKSLVVLLLYKAVVIASFLPSVIHEICKFLPRQFVVVVLVLALKQRVHLYRKCRFVTQQPWGWSYCLMWYQLYSDGNASPVACWGSCTVWASRPWSRTHPCSCQTPLKDIRKIFNFYIYANFYYLIMLETYWKKWK